MDIILLGGLVLGLTQIMKTTTGMTSRYVPLTSLIISLCVFGLYTYLTHSVISWEVVSTALVTALTSVGIWSGVKNTVQ